MCHIAQGTVSSWYRGVEGKHILQMKQEMIKVKLWSDIDGKAVSELGSLGYIMLLWWALCALTRTAAPKKKGLCTLTCSIHSESHCYYTIYKAVPDRSSEHQPTDTLFLKTDTS